MSEHDGFMNVTNSTGGQITNCTASHSTSDGTETNHVGTLAESATSGKVAIKAYTTDRDHWKISFVDSNGNQQIGEWACGFESEDSGGIVNLLLKASEYDMIMPQSSNCSHDYEG